MATAPSLCTRPARPPANAFRNCEMYTVRDGKLVATEVYFGWNLPHRVPKGAHADNNEGRGHA